MTAAQLRALRFVAEHPGGTAHPAYPCGFAWRFDAPELKRAPMRTGTLYALLDLGMIAVSEDHAVTVTDAGRAALKAERESKELRHAS